MGETYYKMQLCTESRERMSKFKYLQMRFFRKDELSIKLV